MPEIYHHSHPYYNPGDNQYKRPDFMHKIIFGNGVEESFPYHLVIACSHHSTWFYMDSSFINKRDNILFNDEIELGDFLRTYMTDDVFISKLNVRYNFPEGGISKPYNPDYTEYFKTNEDGKLIRLPVECIISFILIRFRSEVDKTQFLLMKSDEFTFMDELEDNRKIKDGGRHYDKSNAIRCPICKVKFDEEKYNEGLQALKEAN